MSSEEVEEFKDKKTLILIEDAELSVRSESVLSAMGIQHLNELTELTSKFLLDYRGMGKKSLNEIREKLAFYGMSLKDETVDFDIKKTILIDIPKTLREMKKQIDNMERELQWFSYKIERVANNAEKVKQKEGNESRHFT